MKNARLEGYKKFVVKAYNDKNGRVTMSIPLVEGDYDLLPMEMMNSLWDKYCF
ncbi:MULTISPECIES: hypothetical protein [unclassified Providencia]|uniref:hypothetical protein n=1 Tax=unclassified Providencia TaxID=2633465 RepID=UPI00234958F6|nr:hypothetical protein [Providencia sp. PROV197]